MKAIAIIIFICTCLNINLSAQIIQKDSDLIKKIDTMFNDDQFWRKESMKGKSDYDQATIEKRMELSDSINELKAKAIINKYGYPGYNLVGDASRKFWAIIQHCDDDIPFQEQVLILMKKEIVKNNADKENYAYLVDRVLVNKHQKQIYGTQIHLNSTTHKSAPFPLKYPKSVNKLRKEMGLEPLEVYLKNFE